MKGKAFKNIASLTLLYQYTMAFIIGGALVKILRSLIHDIVMPTFSLLMGGINFSDLMYNIGKTSQGEDVFIKFGNFIGAIIAFTTVVIFIFLLTRPFRGLSINATNHLEPNDYLQTKEKMLAKLLIESEKKNAILNTVFVDSTQK